MSDLAVGTRLDVALRPANTNNATLLTAETVTEVTKIFVCNTTANTPTFRLFHTRGAEVANQTTALFYDTPTVANETREITADAIGGGIHMDVGDKLIVRSSAANELTFTVYGATERIAERTRT